jgi:hypothetical protein
MPGPWTTLNVVLQAAANLFKKPLADLDPLWSSLAADAVQEGYADLVGVLLPRGWTIAQLDAADQRTIWNKDQSIYRLLVAAGALADYPDTFVKPFDRRAELGTVSGILIGGVPQGPTVNPGGSDIGGISHGTVVGATLTPHEWRSLGFIDPPGRCW